MKRFLLSLALCVGLAGTAHAVDPLFVGGEDLDFQLVGAAGVNTTSTFRRTAWSREVLSVGTQPSGSQWPLTNYFTTPDLGNQAVIWIHAQTYAPSATSNLNNNILVITDSAGNPSIAVRGNTGVSQVKLATVTTAVSYSDKVTCTGTAWPQVAVRQLDLFIDYSASGGMTLYLDGAFPCTFSGDITTDSRTAINRVVFGGNFSGQSFFWSEIVISTVDTRGYNVLTMAPVASGNATSWSNSTGSTPCTSTILSPTAYNDTNFVYSQTNNQYEQCTVNPTIASGAWTVLGLWTSARTLIGATGPQHIAFNTRVNSTDYDSADKTPGVTFGPINHFWATNPDTAATWLTTDFTTSGFNIGLKSRP